MSDDTEEKQLPPSEHKLRKAREKGQVANSEGFISAITTVVGVAYLIFTGEALFRIFGDVFNSSIQSYELSNTQTMLNLSLSMYLDLGYYFMGFAGAIMVAAIVSNILEKQGIPFSLDPIKPDFQKISPAAGLKKLFARRNAAEFGTALVKISLWFAVSILFIWLTIQTILTSMHCSIGCVVESTSLLGMLILISAIIMLILSGLIDLPLQQSLFKHEQKMGHKEFKREQKDIYGAPEFKNYRRNEYMRLQEGTDIVNSADELLEEAKTQYNKAVKSIENEQAEAVTLIIRGANGAVGLYYHPEHADVPVVKVRYRGSRMSKELRAAKAKGIPIINDVYTASDILQNLEEGKIILERHFERVALMLVDIGVIG